MNFSNQLIANFANSDQFLPIPILMHSILSLLYYSTLEDLVLVCSYSAFNCNMQWISCVQQTFQGQSTIRVHRKVARERERDVVSSWNIDTTLVKYSAASFLLRAIALFFKCWLFATKILEYKWSELNVFSLNIPDDYSFILIALAAATETHYHLGFSVILCSLCKILFIILNLSQNS